MDLFATIDNYCERTDASFWSEPLNALSNIAFPLMAVWAWRSWQRSRQHAAPGLAVPVLLILMVLIGIGSFLFHTYATVWAVMSDVIPIQIFILVALGSAFRRLLDLEWRQVAGMLVGFIAISVLLGRIIPRGVLNGSTGYLPALAALLIVTVLVARRQVPWAEAAAWRLGLASALLLNSLTFRSVDMAVCEEFAAGTHWGWHLLNGPVLALVILALLQVPRAGQSRSSAVTTPEAAGATSSPAT